MQTKRCSRCGKTKAAEYFYRRSAVKCGLQAACIACQRGASPYPNRDKRVRVFSVVKNGLKSCTCCGEFKETECFYKNGPKLSSKCIYCLAQRKGVIPHERRGNAPKFRHILRTLEGKTCTKCKKFQSWINFYKYKSSLDGFTFWCRGCLSGFCRKWRVERLDIVRAKQRVYLKKKLAVIGSDDWWHYKYKTLTSAKGTNKVYGALSWSDLMNLYRATPQCKYCAISLRPQEARFDHKVPRSRGGSREIENVAVCCDACNRLKWTKTHEEFDRFKREYAQRIISMYQPKLVARNVGGLMDA